MMKNILACILGLVPLVCCYAQPVKVDQLLFQFDSLSKTNSPAAHFASLYKETLERNTVFFETASADTKRLAVRFQQQLATYFLNAGRQTNTAENWNLYFNNSKLNKQQYILLGINAHINGDIWRALTTAFSKDDFVSFKPIYYSFLRSGMIAQYNAFYTQFTNQNKKIRYAGTLSLGLTKSIGRHLVFKWGKRQFKLAEYWYSNKALFFKKEKKLQNKINRVNQLILKNF